MSHTVAGSGICDACGDDRYACSCRFEGWTKSSTKRNRRSTPGLFWGLTEDAGDSDDDSETMSMVYGENPRLDTVMHFERDGLEHLGSGLRAALGVGDGPDVLSGTYSDSGEDEGTASDNEINEEWVHPAMRKDAAKEEEDGDEKLSAWRRVTGFRTRAYVDDGEVPSKRVLFLTLSVVVFLFVVMFWRHLGFHGGQHKNCRPMSHAPIAGVWHYCGPSNGEDFSREPRDVLDTICAQHDFCIENSRYNVGGIPRNLYPVGELAEGEGGEFRRCGIPMRSHTDPVFGCQIKRCDSELLSSLDKGYFSCSRDPALPKSRWCSSQRLIGSSVCPLGWRYPVCATTSTLARLYHHWKVAMACRQMRMGADGGEEDGDGVRWNCTCSANQALSSRAPSPL